MVSGAYKATPVPVLESEVFMPPVELALDQIVAQARLKRGTHPATIAGNERIRQHLKRSKAKKGKRTLVEPPPTEVKLSWVKDKLDLTHLESLNRGLVDAPPEAREAVAKRIARAKAAEIQRWTEERWTERWRRYRDSIPPARRYPALDKEEVTEAHLRRHGIMRKGDSALAIQLRTGKNGLAHFLFTTHAGGRTDASCDCGWRKQDAAHILISCPTYAEQRTGLFEKAGTDDSRKMLSTKRGIRAAARFIMSTGLLLQFSLASEMDEVAEDLTEKIRRRSGKKGKGRNREGYTQQGARHAIDMGAAYTAGIEAMARLPRSEPQGGRTAYARSKQSFAYAAEEWSPEMGLAT